MLLHVYKGAVLVQAWGAGLDPVWDGFSAVSSGMSISV